MIPLFPGIRRDDFRPPARCTALSRLRSAADTFSEEAEESDKTVRPTDPLFPVPARAGDAIHCATINSGSANMQRKEDPARGGLPVEVEAKSRVDFLLLLPLLTRSSISSHGKTLAWVIVQRSALLDRLIRIVDRRFTHWQGQENPSNRCACASAGWRR